MFPVITRTISRIISLDTSILVNFDVLLTVHLSIILVIEQLNAKILVL